MWKKKEENVKEKREKTKDEEEIEGKRLKEVQKEGEK